MHDLAPIVLFICCGLTLFGIVYMRSRENMALIERNINPRKDYEAMPKPFTTVKYALLLMGAGFGLFLGLIITYFLDRSMAGREDNPGIYFALIAFFGGLGLLISYQMERKYLDGKEAKKEVE